MGVLYRRFYRDCEPNTLKTVYTSSMRPLLEYAVPVWDPHLEKDIAALESVQSFATKVCTKAWEDVNYDERLGMLNLPTLKARRYFLKLCFLYKLLNGLAFMPNSLVDYRHNLPYSTRSHSYTLQVPFARTTSYYKSFLCEAPQLWNELPIEVVSSTSFTSFKRACMFLYHE